MVVAMAALLLAGCKREEKKVEKPEEIDAETKAKVEAKLVSADEFDETTDKIVSKCAGCKLGMDGSDKYALTAFGYTMYFCSDDCKKKFEEDTAKAILALEIPED